MALVILSPVVQCPFMGRANRAEKYMNGEGARVAFKVLLKSAALTVLMTGSALALTGERYLSQTVVTPPQARQIALKACPGKIVSEEIEKESGGSGLRYSFIISNKKDQHEIGVDAKTGTLLENSLEGHNPD
jgi:uncharacterized membrane protein YkoI